MQTSTQARAIASSSFVGTTRTVTRDDGVEIVNCRKGGPGNQPRFYARDPDGNLVNLFTPVSDDAKAKFGV